MTFDFLNNVFLLDLAFKPAQRIFKRLAFLNANFRQRNTPPNDPRWAWTRLQEAGFICQQQGRATVCSEEPGSTVLASMKLLPLEALRRA
jgi:hypothetical protein